MKLLKNIFLVYIAIKLLFYLMFPSIIVMLFLSFFKRRVNNGVDSVSSYLYKVALSIDQLGNVVMSELLNITLIKKGGYKFGNPDETISGVIGKNYLKESLSPVGRILDNILNLFEKDHSINAIEGDEYSNKSKK